MTEAARIAKMLTKEVKRFVLAETGKAPVPDSCWHGKYFGILLEMHPNSSVHWRKTKLCHEVADYLRREPQRQEMLQMLRDDDLEDNG